MSSAASAANSNPLYYLDIPMGFPDGEADTEMVDQTEEKEPTAQQEKNVHTREDTITPPSAKRRCSTPATPKSLPPPLDLSQLPDPANQASAAGEKDKKAEPSEPPERNILTMLEY